MRLDGLLADLVRRCDLIRVRLSQPSAHGEVNTLALHLYRSTATCQRDAEALLADPDLHDARLATNFHARFEQIARTVAAIEYHGLPVVERFNDHDAALTRLMRRFGGEAGLTDVDHIVVTASSSGYYWTRPSLGIVGVPAIEGESLLGLPDLAHEAAHLVVAGHEHLILGPLRAAARAHFAAAAGEATARRGAVAARPYRAAAVQWDDRWSVEFACDMLAALLVGASFGYQHSRLAALTGTDPWQPSLGDVASHPADEARERSITSVLRLAGSASAAHAVEQVWRGWADTRFPTGHPEFDECYPQALIDVLADTVHRTATRLGLQTWSSGGSSGTVAEMMNDAWAQFLADPTTYGEWERHTVASLLP